MDMMQNILGPLIGVVIGSATTYIVTSLALKRTLRDNKKLNKDIILNKLRAEVRESLMQHFEKRSAYYSDAYDEIATLWDLDENALVVKMESELIPTLDHKIINLDKHQPNISYIVPELDDALSWFEWMNEVYWLKLTSGSQGKPLLEEIFRVVCDLQNFVNQLSALSNLLLTARLLDQPVKPSRGIPIYRSTKAFVLQIDKSGNVTFTKPEHSDTVYGSEQQYSTEPIMPHGTD